MATRGTSFRNRASRTRIRARTSVTSCEDAAMRILQLIQERRGGGAEAVVDALSRGLTERGHEVSVAAHGSSDPDLTLPLLKRNPLRTLRVARAIRKAISLTDPDVIHAHNPG